MAVIVKIIFIYIKKPHTYLPYVPNMFTEYEKNPPKNCEWVIIPYSAKKMLKWLSLKGRNSLKIYSSP